MKRLALAAACCAAFATSPLLAASELSPGDTLARHAFLAFIANPEESGLVIRSLVAGSPAASAGLANGDVITRVNGASFDKPYKGQALLQDLDGGVPVRLEVRRGAAARTASFTPPPRPLEAIPGVRSIYGSVTTPDGARLRTIISMPEGAAAPLNPLIFTQWVSCGTIEYREGSEAREIPVAVMREAGLALVRVERASDGDSEGSACHELDYDTEVAHYVHAYKELLKSDLIDAGKVYVNGSSLGSTTAPLVALALQKEGYDIAGVAVQGGGGETYFERMLTFDRIYLERRPDAVPPAAIHQEMVNRARFHYHYLINGTHPDEVAKGGPGSAAVRRDIRGMGDGEHYGRPYAWHQQAAKHNFLAAWAEIDAPVLVVFNEFDQFEAQYGADVIVNAVNRLRPGSASLVVQKGLDHSSYRFATIEDAYADRNGTPAWRETATAIANWLKPIVAR